MRFDGKVCVITGASSGIGRKVASDLAEAGAIVCAVARREQLLSELIAALPGEGHSFCVADVSDRGAVAGLAKHVADVHGRVDVLVNNAGYSRVQDLAEEGAVSTLEEVMSTNFFGAVYCTEALLEMLIAAAPSHVINIASVAGRLALGGSSTYTASKFALVGWSEALHFELEDRGVHVGLIEPGPLPTEGFPQAQLARQRLLRLVLTDVDAVSAAVVDSISKRKLQRVVPRWYYLLQIPRLFTPPLYRSLLRRFTGYRAGD